MSIDNVHHKVKLTSIMRDVRVYMGDGSPYDSGYDKLNHAYMYGGPEQAIRAINPELRSRYSGLRDREFLRHGEDCGCVRRCKY